jgi:outer membrane receptor protein involved in Fe transport
MLNDAKVLEFERNPALVGLYLPQVPKHRGSMQITYANPRFVNLAFGIQGVGRQFEDDLNARLVPGETEPGLPGYALLDVTASRVLHQHLEVFFGIQNLTDKEYIAFTQPTTTGSPRLVHGGVRVWLGSR